MGNFNLKSIWKQTGGTGGSTNLEQRVQNIETNYVSKNANALQNINGSVDIYGNMIVKQEGFVDRVAAGDTAIINKRYLTEQLNTIKNQIKKRELTITNTRGQTYIIEPTTGYAIISVMVGRKRTSEGYYFFTCQPNLNFQLFLDTDGKYKIYTEGPVSGFDGTYKVIIVEMKV